MTWRHSAGWLSGGMALSAGLVWLGRVRRWRGDLPRTGQIGADEEEAKLARRARLEAKADEIVREERMARSSIIDEVSQLCDAARNDALRDMHASEDEELGLDADTRREPQEIGWLETGGTVRSTEHVGAQDEPYDAVDAEDAGSEWLLRATQSAPSSGRDPVDVLEGTDIFDVSRTEPITATEEKFGSEPEREPLAPHAGTAEEDIAAQLPVGTVDDAGNVELHAPILPPDALDAPPTGALSPTEEELTRRAGARRAAIRKAARRERR